MCYHLNAVEKAIVNGKTGELVRPKCWTDLEQYHSYLMGKGKRHHREADQLLKDVFHGEQVISKMVAKSQKLRASKRNEDY